MDNEQRTDYKPKEEERQIQLVVNRSGDEEDSINLGNVFYNMKRRRRLFAWVFVLCLTIGICGPLLFYQVSKPMLTVSSVVTLQYEVPIKIRQYDEYGRERWVVPENPKYEPVSDLTAPDGKELDPNQITSAYVLQTALDGMMLSQPITASDLRTNITIQTVLTDESQKIRESLIGLADLKNPEAYTRLQGTTMKYKNRFVVYLTNGFKGENGDSSNQKELKDEELAQLLDRVLNVYNDYLVKTYADIRLPEDKFSVIDTQELDIMDSLDQLRDGIQDLKDYCEEKTDTVRMYRSWRTGRSLNDWIETLETFRDINVDYLYTMVSENAVTREKTALLTSYKFLLRNAKNDLKKIDQDIEETKKILSNYKNDDIYISMQESDGSKTTKAVTSYYNNLILQQVQNYDKAAELKITIADYEDRILRLESTPEAEVSEQVETELSHCMETAQSLYEEIREHMEELFGSSMYTTYEKHSVPVGKEQSFLRGSVKLVIIGIVASTVIALGIWFLAGLVPEFGKKSGKNAEKEADRK